MPPACLMSGFRSMSKFRTRKNPHFPAPEGSTEYKGVARCSAPDGELPSDHHPEALVTPRHSRQERPVDMWTIGGADRLRFPRFPSKLEKWGNARLRPHTHRLRQQGELIIDDFKEPYAARRTHKRVHVKSLDTKSPIQACPRETGGLSRGDRHGVSADHGADLHHSPDPQLAGVCLLERPQADHARSESDLPGGNRRDG